MLIISCLKRKYIKYTMNTYILSMCLFKCFVPFSWNIFRLICARMLVMRCLLRLSNMAISVGIKCRRISMQTLISLSVSCHCGSFTI